MKSWQEDLLNAAVEMHSPTQLFEKVAGAARSLGFEHCAYGLRVPLSFSNPKTFILSTYPEDWQRRYQEAGYLAVDPTVVHGRKTQAPLIWTENLFSEARDLWDEARSFGLCIGWAKATLSGNGCGGMLTVARSHDELDVKELESQEFKLRWLANVSHLILSRALTPATADTPPRCLTGREIEVMKWTADGKTSGEISSILSISENTVNFHIKNAVVKLNTSNKTAAAVRAVVLGILT